MYLKVIVRKMTRNLLMSLSLMFDVLIFYVYRDNCKLCMNVYYILI